MPKQIEKSGQGASKKGPEGEEGRDIEGKGKLGIGKAFHSEVIVVQ
jgi:hypothetical protein